MHSFLLGMRVINKIYWCLILDIFFKIARRVRILRMQTLLTLKFVLLAYLKSLTSIKIVDVLLRKASIGSNLGLRVCGAINSHKEIICGTLFLRYFTFLASATCILARLNFGCWTPASLLWSMTWRLAFWVARNCWFTRPASDFLRWI